MPLKCTFVIFLYLSTIFVAQAGTPGSNNDKSLEVNTNYLFLGPDLFYNYFDFKFNSNTTNNFKRYEGHSNLYGAAGRTFFLKHQLLAGLGVYRINTELNSETLLNPAPQFNTSQSIDNTTIYGHIARPFFNILMVDLTAGYGRNNIHSRYSSMPSASLSQNGWSKNHSNNYFTSLTAFAKKTWPSFLLNTNIGVLYSQVNSDQFIINYPSPFLSNTISSLTNKTTWLYENVQLTYRKNEHLQPYIKAGLIQVLDTSFSRSLLNAPVIGALPQLYSIRSGYKVGGGIRINYRKLALNVGYQYYEASSSFKSHQTSAKLSYLMA